MVRRHLALVLIATALTAVAVVAGPSVAAPRSGSGGGAAISFDPPQVIVGQQYVVNGSGFRPNCWVTVGAHYGDVIYWNSGQTDGQGSISLTFTARSAGQIYHEAKELNEKNARMRFKASATLTVDPAP